MKALNTHTHTHTHNLLWAGILFLSLYKARHNQKYVRCTYIYTTARPGTGALRLCAESPISPPLLLLLAFLFLLGGKKFQTAERERGGVEKRDEHILQKAWPVCLPVVSGICCVGFPSGLSGNKSLLLKGKFHSWHFYQLHQTPQKVCQTCAHFLADAFWLFIQNVTDADVHLQLQLLQTVSLTRYCRGCKN